MKLVIDRQKWGMGRLLRTAAYNAHSWHMLKEDVNVGKRCCLGFYCSALGVPDSALDCGMPSSIKYGEADLPTWILEGTQSGDVDVNVLAKINDRVGIYADLSDSRREAEIATIFAKHDVQVEFIN